MDELRKGDGLGEFVAKSAVRSEGAGTADFGAQAMDLM